MKTSVYAVQEFLAIVLTQATGFVITTIVELHSLFGCACVAFPLG